jgi:hypothetical protein
MEIDFITVTYMQTPGRWVASINFRNGEVYHSTVNHGPWELYTNSKFPGIPVKLYDWKSKSWADGNYDLA